MQVGKLLHQPGEAVRIAFSGVLAGGGDVRGNDGDAKAERKTEALWVGETVIGVGEGAFLAGVREQRELMLLEPLVEGDEPFVGRIDVHDAGDPLDQHGTVGRAPVEAGQGVPAVGVHGRAEEQVGVPGDFAGGSVRIQTRELPTKPLLQGSLGFGFNDHATFRQRLAQRGSSTDFLGFDDGTRALPELLRQKPYVALTPAELKDASQGINSYMSAVRTFTPPNGSASVVAGNGWSLGNDQRIGALVALNYSRSFSYRDDGIVRNRAKIAATVANARAFLLVQREHGSFDRYVWRFVDDRPVQNRWRTPREVPAETETARALSRDLKARGFAFVGPTICYAFMQATGMVNDHLVGCFRRREIERGVRP